mgnify:CR=1 FL=1
MMPKSLIVRVLLLLTLLFITMPMMIGGLVLVFLLPNLLIFWVPTLAKFILAHVLIIY